MKTVNKKLISELRRDPVSGDWILLAPIRGKRNKFEGRAKMKLAKNKCPFEDPRKFGNEPPSLVYQKDDKSDWFLQAMPNKYPAVMPDGRKLAHNSDGLYQTKASVGYHEIVVFRDHDRYLADFNIGEIEKVISAYRERFQNLAGNKFVEYISIFHNHGKEAGSTVAHPHSQILALPIVPPDISHSLSGSRNYFHKHHKCIHCEMMKAELKEKKRIIYENKEMIVVAPFASRSDFEIRIFPRKHSAYFEKIGDKNLKYFAEALKMVLFRINKKFNDPAFNFFIHTAPLKKNGDYNHYHWHMEILPKFEIIGSVELGTGLNIISIPPEKAAEMLRN